MPEKAPWTHARIERVPRCHYVTWSDKGPGGGSWTPARKKGSAQSLLRQFADRVLGEGGGSRGGGEGGKGGGGERGGGVDFGGMQAGGAGGGAEAARGSLEATLRGLKETQGRLKRLVADTKTLERSQGELKGRKGGARGLVEDTGGGERSHIGPRGRRGGGGGGKGW